MDVTRRGWVAAAAGIGVAVLSGCGGGSRLARSCQEAAEAVDGVTSARFEARTGAEFQSSLVGSIGLDGTGQSEVLGLFDDALRAVVTTIHDELGSEKGSYRRVGGITGSGTDGTAVTPMDLDPAWPEGATPSDDAISAGQFYERYGLH